ncbi:hypothetical protein BDR26DRAFT_876095 [Obelidium mucronatum]|nr:hypothetical protein BDR26DRAFT_876095 [Obelidium mucronatum]
MSESLSLESQIGTRESILPPEKTDAFHERISLSDTSDCAATRQTSGDHAAPSSTVGVEETVEAVYGPIQSTEAPLIPTKSTLFTTEVHEAIARNTARDEKANLLFSEMNAAQRDRSRSVEKGKKSNDLSISNNESSSSATTENPVFWSVNQVSLWLKAKSVADEIVAKFIAQAINGQALMLLNLENLKNDLDIDQLGTRIALLDLISSLKRDPDVTDDPPAYS